MNKKTIGIIAISVVLGAFILVCVKEKVDDFNQNPTKQMWDLYKESEKISKTPLKELLNKEVTGLFIILMVKQEMVVLNNSFTIVMIKSILLYKPYKMFIWKTVHAI